MDLVLLSSGASLALAGLGIFLYTLLRGKRLSEKPVDFEFKKLDLRFQGTHLTLAMLLGFGVTVIGTGMLYAAYSSRQGALEGALGKARSELETVKEFAQKFKSYDLKVLLVFPEQVDQETLEISAHRAKSGELAAGRFPARKVLGEDQTVWAELDNLNSGDRIRFEALVGGRRWVSQEAVFIPRTRVVMKAADSP